MTKPQQQQPPRKQLSDFPAYRAEVEKLQRLERRERELRAELARESERASQPPVDRKAAIKAVLNGEPVAAARTQRMRDAADSPTWGDLSILEEAIAAQRNIVGREYSIAAAAIGAELRPEYQDLVQDIHAVILHLEELLDLEVQFHSDNREARPWSYGCTRQPLAISGKISQWRRSAIDAGLLDMTLKDFYALDKHRDAADADSLNLAN